MDFKTSKTLSILVGGTVFVAFFLPWIKPMFGSGVSAWELVKALFDLLSRADRLPEDLGVYLVFLMVVFPISSAIIIIGSLITFNAEKETLKTQKATMIIAIILAIIALIHIQNQIPFSKPTSIFSILGIGFYLTLIGSVYFLFDAFTTKTKSTQTNRPTPGTVLYCSNCGKPYYAQSAGNFCEQCGEKIIY